MITKLRAQNPLNKNNKKCFPSLMKFSTFKIDQKHLVLTSGREIPLSSQTFRVLFRLSLIKQINILNATINMLIGP